MGNKEHIGILFFVDFILYFCIDKSGSDHKFISQKELKDT